MRHDGEHPADDAHAPHQVPRPCDHCATVLPESELVPLPKTSSYLVHAPELLCGPCWQRTRSRSIRMPKYRAISERCLMDHDLQNTVSYDIANCTACGASFFFVGPTCSSAPPVLTCGLIAWIVNVLGTCAQATTSDSTMLRRELVGKPCISPRLRGSRLNAICQPSEKNKEKKKKKKKYKEKNNKGTSRQHPQRTWRPWMVMKDLSRSSSSSLTSQVRHHHHNQGEGQRRQQQHLSLHHHGEGQEVHDDGGACASV